MGSLELLRKTKPFNARRENGDESHKTLTVCLVTAFSLTDFVDPELTLKSAKSFSAGSIGVLTLAAVLRETGFRPYVVDLDQLFLDFLGSCENRASGLKDQAVDRLSADNEPTRNSEGSSHFFQFVMESLKSLSFDVFGFSSICSSYPLTLRLANEIKKLNPNSLIVLGGPQASVVDMETMRAFPSIDFVVRGEAEHTFPTLLDSLSRAGRSSDVETIRGITFRRDEEVVRNSNAPVIDDLDLLPLPAFDLDPDFTTRGSVYLELGRGCPFACTFCSTNDFFRRNFRLKSPQKMIEEMKSIKTEHGISNFSLIHDMYTIDRRKVVAFCEALIECGQQFTWTCSARTDCIDDELISLMAKAGCVGIFFGIETGSSRLQSVIKKNLDLGEARERIQCASQHGIKTAVALITAFPDETKDDLRDTVHFFVDALRFDHAEPQLSLLAPLAATPIHDEYKDRLTLDHIFSDMSHQGWRQDPADEQMIMSYPGIFSNFYAVPTHWLERNYFKEARDFTMYLAARFRWLPVALLQDSGDFLKVFDRWRMWIAEKSSDRPNADQEAIVPYYSHCQFWKDFLEFVQTCYVEELAAAPTAIATLVECERMSQARVGKSGSATVVETDLIDVGHFPVQVKNSVVVDLGADYNEIISRLRRREDLRGLPAQSVSVAFRPRNEAGIEVLQLSPLSAALLRLCDGKRSAEEIIREFALLESDWGGVPAEKACLFGLMQLRAEKLLDISREPIPDVEQNEGANESDESGVVPRYPSSLTFNTQQPWPWPAKGLA